MTRDQDKIGTGIPAVIQQLSEALNQQPSYPQAPIDQSQRLVKAFMRIPDQETRLALILLTEKLAGPN